jgi:hypothetical protein
MLSGWGTAFLAFWTSTVEPLFLFVANAVAFAIDGARRETHGLNTSQTKAAARFNQTAATHAGAAGAQLCGGGGGGGGDAERERRSAMN